MDLQVIFEEIKREWKEDPQKSKDESEIISKYGNIFNPKNIDNLTIEDFRSFLSIKNNKHWRSLERLGHVITDDLGKLKNTLKILLDETIPIEERIRRIRDKNSNDYHKWFGSAYYTPILLVVYPKKYPVINEIVKDALQKTGLYPNYDSKPEWRAYAEVIPKIQQLAEQYHLSLWQIDSVWWKYQMKNDVVASGTKESILEPLEPSLWLIRAGDKGQGAQTALENNCVGIGYGGLPGLHLIKEYEKFKEHYKKTHPEDNKYQVGQIIRQIWNFMYEVKVGDFVLLPLGQKSNALAVGKIVGEYQYKHLHSEIEQYRPVHWLKKDVNKDEFEPEIQESFDDRGTVHYIGDLDVVNKLKDMLKKLGVNEIDLENIDYINNKPIPITYNKNDYDIENKWLSLKNTDIEEITQNVLAAKNKRLEIDENIVKRIISHLVVSKHVILIGPPGTGKTDLARRILRELGNKIIDDEEPLEAVASYE